MPPVSLHGLPPVAIHYAYLTIQSYLAYNVFITMKITDCQECDPRPIQMIYPRTASSLFLTTHTGYRIGFSFYPNGDPEICSVEVFLKDATDNYVEVSHDRLLKAVCRFHEEKVPNLTSTPLFVPEFLIIMAFPALMLLWSYLIRKSRKQNIAAKPETSEIKEISGNPTEKTLRLRSLDSLRGFTLALTIFGNSGGGGFYQFNHTSWFGMNIADIAHPGFTALMGTSMGFMIINQKNRRQFVNSQSLIYKTVLRSMKLYIAGFTLNSLAFSNDLTDIPMMGVMQIFAVINTAVVLIELYFPSPSPMDKITLPKLGQGFHTICQWLPIRESIIFWRHYVVILSAAAIHTGVLLFLEVPGCGRGYLGPGGNHKHGSFVNCTGGAIGYVDKILFGSNHMMKSLEYQFIYGSGQPYDTYNFMSIFSQLMLVYFGILMAEIYTIHKKKPEILIKYCIGTALYLLILTAFMCNGVQNDGIIPLHRNLWTVSYVTFNEMIILLCAAVTFYVVDLKKLTNGHPFIHYGTNIFFLFVLHILLREVFPVGWKPIITKSQAMFLSLWQVFLFGLIAKYLDDNNIHIKA